MKTYTKCDAEVTARVKRLIKEFHSDLSANEVRVECLFIASSDPDGAALKHQGYPAAAVVRVLDSKARTAGRGDAEIVIDEKGYIDMTPEKRDALIDHELYHIEVKKNRYGRTMTDENKRPKLKLKLHDRQYGWFDEIAKRHGAASGEIMQATHLFLSGRQTYFEFALSTKLTAGVKATVKLLP
jgi:hypothetical protein